MTTVGNDFLREELMNWTRLVRKHGKEADLTLLIEAMIFQNKQSKPHVFSRISIQRQLM